jgi:hypothetical protein
MSDRDEEHPELAGYEPGDGRPLRHPMTLRIMRVVVVLGIIGLVLPTAYSAVSTNISVAHRACEIVVAQSDPRATAAEPRFEFGADGPGWYCYSIEFGGDEVLLRWLGLIPEIRQAPATPGVDA